MSDPVRRRRPGPGALTGLAGLAVAAQLAPAASDIPVVRRWLPGLQGDGGPASIALTFDDGPDPESTPQISAELDRLGVRATFFLLATMTRRFPGSARELVAAGHEIGVHGWDHRNLLRVPPVETVRGVRDARDLIAEVTGVRPRYFRPPYGVLSGAAVVAARTAGLRTVLWGSWGRDWEPTATATSVVDEVCRTLRPGHTVLLHDSDCTSAPRSWRATRDALPELVRRCSGLGVTVGPLGGHLR